MYFESCPTTSSFSSTKMHLAKGMNYEFSWIGSHFLSVPKCSQRHHPHRSDNAKKISAWEDHKKPEKENNASAYRLLMNFDPWAMVLLENRDLENSSITLMVCVTCMWGMYMYMLYVICYMLYVCIYIDVQIVKNV